MRFSFLHASFPSSCNTSENLRSDRKKKKNRVIVQSLRSVDVPRKESSHRDWVSSMIDTGTLKEFRRTRKAKRRNPLAAYPTVIENREMKPYYYSGSIKWSRTKTQIIPITGRRRRRGTAREFAVKSATE